MKKIIKLAKAELQKKNKSPEERACIETILRVAKSMRKNYEIKIKIIPPTERIHLVPSGDEDGWHPCEKEMLDAMMNMGVGCCGGMCHSDEEDPTACKTIPPEAEHEKDSRAEAGESM